MTAHDHNYQETTGIALIIRCHVRVCNVKIVLVTSVILLVFIFHDYVDLLTRTSEQFKTWTERAFRTYD